MSVQFNGSPRFLLVSQSRVFFLNVCVVLRPFLPLSSVSRPFSFAGCFLLLVVLAGFYHNLQHWSSVSQLSICHVHCVAEIASIGTLYFATFTKYFHLGVYILCPQKQIPLFNVLSTRGLDWVKFHLQPWHLHRIVDFQAPSCMRKTAAGISRQRKVGKGLNLDRMMNVFVSTIGFVRCGSFSWLKGKTAGDTYPSS